MKLVTTVAEAKEVVSSWKKEGKTIGFVPTMGFLHQGHSSLMEKARKNNDKVVVSIFVNPTQFALGEDLDSYPRDLSGDSEICKNQGVDLIFAPTVAEMYPSGFSTSVTMSGLSQELCGKSRPTHFSGVCLVVSKLFHIISPDTSYFGEKDAQQLAIIRQMVLDLNMDVKIIGCPIVREEDGLALSSRNSYLQPDERKAALILSKALAESRKLLENGEENANIIRETLANVVATEPLGTLDYGEVVDSLSLQPVEKVVDSVLIALAVQLGKTRLIDNFTFKREDKTC